ncbi:MAG TPA: hypothetical protein VHM89_00055 [Acidimicrobiales bacterium]|nr:hypothetical protein [Acidimicrobiales bacterium]
MLLSDLLRARVIDAEGRDVGVVSDVRLVQDGPILFPFGAALRVEALVVGRLGVGVRLGYLRGDVTGPRLLHAVFAALERRARLVRWEDVESWDGGSVRVRVRAADLASPS